MLMLVAALTTGAAARAADRLPDELLGCWEWSKGTETDAIYNRVSAENCKALLISTNGYKTGEDGMDCRLRSVLSAKLGRYRFRFQCVGGPMFTSTMMLRGNQLTVRETIR